MDVPILGSLDGIKSGNFVIGSNPYVVYHANIINYLKNGYVNNFIK
jgi:hypothetical protein